ncbi:MAG: ATP cone domain-containing protein, partial [Candidatus ainarchaeum sp.]|nr:ATP cone domain-containing protein [Candidatus ainarchaeum sp.]
MNMLTKIKKITQVKKRKGEIVFFDKNKISLAIEKAMKSVDSFDENKNKDLTEKVILILESKFINKIPSVEDVSDVIEYVLIASELINVAKSFILYREERRKLRESYIEEIDCDIVKDLKEKKISITKQAINVLNNSNQFKDLGLIIFLDRYSIKSKKNEIVVGDLVVVISKNDPKYPKKDIGIVKDISENKFDVKLHMLTGLYAEKENNYEFNQKLSFCEKPSESAN